MGDIKDLNLDIGEIGRIHHLADVHVRNFSRHEEYEKVLDRLYDRIEENATDNSLITVLGDVVHSKTDMSPELIDFVSNFLRNLESIRPVLLIPGNHDANVSNDERLDALTPIVNNLNLENLRYIKESGLYKIGDTVFSHFSVFDDKSKYVSASKIPDKYRKIALYHGIVDRSVTNYGYVLENENMTEFDFIGFDSVLLGDIHKKQKISDYEVEKMVVDEEDAEDYLNSNWEVDEIMDDS